MATRRPQPSPTLPRRTLRAAALALLTFALGTALRAQEEPPPPPPPEPAAEATESSPQDAPPQGPPKQDKKRGLELPEFEPVAAPPLSGLDGKQFFWFTMYPHFVAKFDPTTDEVVAKVKLEGGLFWSPRLTHDRKRLLVVTDQQQSIEVVDLKTATLAGRHPFREEGMILRIRDVRECPGGRHWLVQTDRVKKELDRYSFEASQWLLYDSVEQKVVRKVKKLPEALTRSAELSADGTHWIAEQDGDLKFLDARTFEELGSIDLKTPRFFGAGALRLSGTDLLDGRDPKRALMIFTQTDPVEKRRTNWGLVDLDLENRRVAEVTEWGPSKSTWSLRVAHRPRIGVAMSGGRGGRNGEASESRLVSYDLNTGAQLAEAWHRFRPRRSLVAIAPDASKVYVGVAGSDFEVFDGKTLARLPSVELDGEIVGRIFVVDE